MTTLLIFLCSLVFISAALPIAKRIFDKMTLEVAVNQIEGGTAIVKESVGHVNQISRADSLSSEEKKELAVDLSMKLASNMKIPENQQELVGDLIESAIWKLENYIDDEGL